MQWALLRRTQIDAFDRRTPVLLPVAATEQHGEHLPLATDWLIGEEVARRVDKSFASKLLIMPTLRVGCSEHHMQFPGSLTLTHETFRRVVMDTVDSTLRHGFKRVVILNSHGGNQAVNSMLSEQLGQQYAELECGVLNWWTVAAPRLKELQEGPVGSVGHACEFETSIILRIAPELVDMSSAVDDGVQHHSPSMKADLLQRPPAAWYRPFQAMTKSGVFGMPSLASAEKGERVLEAATTSLHDLLVEFWPDLPSVVRA